MLEKLVEKLVVRDSIEGFDDVKEDGRQLLAPTHGIESIPAQQVDVIEGGEGMPEARLVDSKEGALLKEGCQTLLDDPLKGAADDARDGNDAIRRGIRAIPVLVKAERVGVSPAFREHTTSP